MNKITLTVRNCTSADEVYVRLLSALKAPVWHGHNLDALWDGLTGELYEVTAPLIISVDGHQSLPTDLQDLLARMQAIFIEAKDTQQLDVSFHLA